MRKIKLELNKDDFKNKLGIENGKDGHTPTKKELTDLIKPLIPEPKKEVIIEKIEVVKEQPIIKEVAKYETPEEIADKINTLDGQIDFKVLTNVPKKTTGVINRYFSGGNSGNMLKSVYDPDGGERQVAFKDEVLTETYESISKNLKSYPYTFNKTGDVLNSIVYTVPGGTITKTFNYSGDNVTSIVLSGNTPSGINLTKTLGYTGSTLTTITYS